MEGSENPREIAQQTTDYLNRSAAVLLHEAHQLEEGFYAISEETDGAYRKIRDYLENAYQKGFSDATDIWKTR